MIKKIFSIVLCSLVLLSALSGLTASAVEVTKNITFKYMRSGVWSSFSGKTEFSNYLDCIRITTPSSKNYYLNYRTWNEGKSGYYSYVQSNKTGSEDYAGASGRRIRNIAIQVINSSTGAKISTGIVVMYRAKVNGVWLSWVSNADPEWMRFVQRKYGLDGVLDTKSGNAGLSDGSFIEGLDIRIFEESAIVDSKGTAGKSKVINAPFISQVGTYPTGCESVSTVMALNHAGDNISVDTFIDTYLPKGNATSFDPNICFGGDPRSSAGMGCYAPVIESAASKATKGKRITVSKLNNKSLSYLCSNYIDHGVPVVIWATSGNMAEAYIGKSMTYEGRKIQWIAPEHCLLLVGYDENNYIFNDPLKSQAKTYYPRNSTENAYYALGAQAVVIEALPKVEDTEFRDYSLHGEVEVLSCFDILNRGYKTEVDLITVNSGRSLGLTAYYSSAYQAKGIMGIGWYSDIEKRIVKAEEEIYLYQTPTRYARFVKQTDNVYKCISAGMKDYSIELTANGYTVDCNQNGRELYDLSGRLVKTIDKHGFETVISYSTNSIKVTDCATSAELVLYLNGGKVTNITASDSGSVTFSYNGDMLTRLITPKETAEFSYDIYGRMLAETRSDRTSSIAYNSNGQLLLVNSSVFGYNGNEITVANESARSVYSFNNENGLVSYTSPKGNISTFAYDGDFNVISQNINGTVTEITYHSKGRPATVTNAQGKCETYYYDSNGNLIRKTYPLSGDADSDGEVNIKDIIRFKRYLAGEEAVVADWNIDFSSGDNAVALATLRKTVIEKPENELKKYEKFSYNAKNQLISYKDLNGNTVAYSYDEYGNLKK